VKDSIIQSFYNQFSLCSVSHEALVKAILKPIACDQYQKSIVDSQHS